MALLPELLSTLPLEPVPVRKVIIGAHWTLVSSKHGGLASTVLSEGLHGQNAVREVGNLHNHSAQELAGWILSDNPLEASIGLAAINSLIDVDEKRLVDINAAEVIAQKAKEKNLAIVGHFPFVERLRGVTQNTWVIEKRPHGEDYPEEAAAEYLPQADVVAITAMSFINHTVEGLLSLCRPEALVMVLGPSTPLSDVLFRHGVDILSGTRVIDENLAVETIQQGATFQQVKGVRLVSMTKMNG